MKNNKVWLVVPAFFFLVGALALAGQKTSVSTSQHQKATIAVKPCPDIAIISFTARLVSTQVGDASVEIPHDTVRLDATLSNIGTLSITRAMRYHVELSQNGEVIEKKDENELLIEPGSRRVLRWVKTFPHDVKTTYTVSVSADLDECRKDNNQATLTIDEKKLHPVKLAPRAKTETAVPIKKF